MWAYLSVLIVVLALALQVVGTTTTVSKVAVVVIAVAFLGRLWGTVANRQSLSRFEFVVLVVFDLGILALVITGNQFISVWPSSHSGALAFVFLALVVISSAFGCSALFQR